MSNMFGGGEGGAGKGGADVGGSSADDSQGSSSSSRARDGPAGGGKGSAKQRLMELNDLKQAGLVTEAEYGEKRKAILSGL